MAKSYNTTIKKVLNECFLFTSDDLSSINKYKCVENLNKSNK